MSSPAPAQTPPPTFMVILSLPLPVTRAELQREFKALARRLGKTIVFVTHDLREALLLASHIILLEKGRVVASAGPEEFLRLQHPEVLAFAASLDVRGGAA